MHAQRVTAVSCICLSLTGSIVSTFKWTVHDTLFGFKKLKFGFFHSGLTLSERTLHTLEGPHMLSIYPVQGELCVWYERKIPELIIVVITV